MISLPFHRRYSPIGVDLGSRSVKLVQFTADYKQLVDAVCWDVPREVSTHTPEASAAALTLALRQAREKRKFMGSDAVLCLGRSELFLQNLRLPKATGVELERLVQQEAAGRIPFNVAEAEIRFLEASDVRQGDATLREVIVFACHRPVLARVLKIVEDAGLNPIAVDVQSNALVRAYTQQFRRDEDRQQRAMLVHIGYSCTAVVIVQGDETLLMKYLPIGGRDFDDAVAAHLHMEPHEAAALRRHNGDRRADQQDPEVAQSVAEAARAQLDKLIAELSLCIRYHSVTFRGQPLARLVLGGGEASEPLRETLAKRLDIKCELCDPLRPFASQARSLRQSQWDVAAGLAWTEAGGKR
jgi:type IV pilus assembly protein PilM